MSSLLKTLALALALFATASLNAAPFEIEGGYEYADVSGIRSYNARGLRDKITSDRSVPVLGVRFHALPSLNVGLAYRHFKDIKASGVSPDSNVFGDAGGGFTALTPYSVSEDIREITLDARYAFSLIDDLRFEIGPVLSAYRSVADFTSHFGNSNAPLRHFSSSDIRLGATAVLTYRVFTRWTVHASYRYTNPPSRELHVLGAGFGFRL